MVETALVAEKWKNHFIHHVLPKTLKKSPALGDSFLNVFFDAIFKIS